MSDQLTVEFDDADAQASLRAFDAAVLDRLVTVEAALRLTLYGNIEAHAPERTGAYKKSIQSETDETATGVWSDVEATDPIASFIERGATIPAHEILPNVAQALSFMIDGRHIFAARVESPGGTIKPEFVLTRELIAMEPEISAQMQDAANEVADQF
jgi:hypothetical protein